jgi:UDP-N-acetylmuramyl tripeptide synthase
MERFRADDRDVCLILVKNPVGMDRALEFVRQAPDYGAALLLLNASDPDGRDVSWIWDVDFEQNLLPGVLGVSGIRAADLALRLHYAGKDDADLLVDSNALAVFDRQLAQCPPGRCLYVLPNYTAMLDLRASLAKRYELREFWKKGG